MLRSSVQLTELLKQPPTVLTQAGAPTVQDAGPRWVPKKRFKPSRTHWIDISRQSRTASPSAGITAEPSHITAEFTYSRALSLADDPQLIRLLCVNPGQKHDPIVCTLEYATAESSIHYEAVSYCWGGQSSTILIDCDEQPLLITENLNAAIVNVRRNDECLLIWADAICIDQSSIAEKNCQVPLMRQIYSNAAIVHIWLGADTPLGSCQEAFNALKALAHAYRKLGWDFDFMRQESNSALSECIIPALDDPSWKSIGQLLQRPWFSRAWIIQEVTVSRQAVLRCGQSSLTWQEFQLGLLFAMNTGLLFYQYDFVKLSTTYRQLVSLLTTYTCFVEQETRYLDLITLLEAHRCVDATDPKDKVYALLGLSTNIDGRPHTFVTDYDLSTSEVYKDVAKAVLSKSHTLDLLSVPGITKHPSFPSPSWTPDWSGSHLTNSLTFKDSRGKYVLDFNAARTDRFAKEMSFRGESLILQGHVFDTIAHVGQIMDPFGAMVATSNPSSDTAKQPAAITSFLYLMTVLSNWEDLCGRFARRDIYTTAPESLDTTFMRTIHLDDFTRGYTLETSVQQHKGLMVLIGRKMWSALFEWPMTARVLNWYDEKLVKRAIYRINKDAPAANNVTDKLARTLGRRMVVTQKGYLGLAPDRAEEGNYVVLVKGGRVPLVLRRKDKGERWELLGDSYVHGIMHGEGFEEGRCVDIEII